VNDDDTFRLVLIIYCVVFMPVGLYHRIQSYTGEKIDRWQEGIFILFGLRLIALAMFAGGIAWMIQPRWMAWSSMPIPVWLRWSGIAMAGIGGVLFSLAVHSLGKNLTDTVITRKDHSLVTTGPYSFVRHPFYVASALGAVGVCLAMANWLLLVAFIVGFGFLVARTRIEEEKLIERFGDDYREYMAKTGRFFPRISAGN
jgi:protein-S-isoprenylcysteine O-methyltransferase Ste14